MLRLDYAEEEPADETDCWSAELTINTDDPNMVRKLRRLYRELLSDQPGLAAVPRRDEE